MNQHQTQKEKPVTAVAQAESQCAACGQSVPKGARCLWVKGAGVFHEDCTPPDVSGNDMSTPKPPNDKQLETRQALAALLGGLDAIEQSLATAPLERQVEIGSVLWELDNHLDNLLEKIKGIIREEAVVRLGGQVGTTLIQGEDRGEAGVRILEADLRVPKHIRAEDLRRSLGSAFDKFFKEKISLSPREDFETLVPSVTDAAQQKTLHDAVERVELTPRVSFRRHRLSKRDDSP